ncbi:hypothetical protein GCM10010156_77460 [Planobispora rosea]|uniref:Uncharacterized protein n=1 Tax=Planobispora rosea TaxID=35762 RepID=A0A8J3WGE9_PLARO|nr:hypothetical protein GCM10010156_77460 [Planobispora rosea]GIH89254.1 hypothetical protein Pro02_76620 [Planobispora rosea]
MLPGATPGIGDVNMATTLSMKARQAWGAGNARRCVRLAEAVTFSGRGLVRRAVAEVDDS